MCVRRRHLKRLASRALKEGPLETHWTKPHQVSKRLFGYCFTIRSVSHTVCPYPSQPQQLRKGTSLNQRKTLCAVKHMLTIAPGTTAGWWLGHPLIFTPVCRCGPQSDVCVCVFVCVCACVCVCTQVYHIKPRDDSVVVIFPVHYLSDQDAAIGHTVLSVSSTHTHTNTRTHTHTHSLSLSLARVCTGYYHRSCRLRVCV